LSSFVGGGRRTDDIVAQQDSQHDACLHGDEGRADATANTTAVTDPFRGIGTSGEETIGIEASGVVADGFVGVEQSNAGNDRVSLGHRPVSDLLCRGLCLTERRVDDRTGALNLEDGGVE
jgi:hypothetical protein